jgi:Domain of unknown function (DUF4410)
MTRSTSLLFVSLLFLAAIAAGCVGAQQTSPDNVLSAGGLTPNVKDKDAGLVAVAPGFDIKRYKTIAVTQLAVTDKMDDDGDRRFAAEMSMFFQAELVRHLRGSGLFVKVVNAGETKFESSSETVLKVEGAITRLGRGSQAMRYLVGYGAGAARAQADMKFVEVPSGKVVMVVADRRIASAGAFGGSDREHLRESFDDMARDLAKFLVRLSKGEAPKE